MTNVAAESITVAGVAALAEGRQPETGPACTFVDVRSSIRSDLRSTSDDHGGVESAGLGGRR